MQRLMASDFDDEIMDEFEPSRFFRECGAAFGEEPRQPLDRCVSHTVTCIIREVEAESQGEDNLQLSRKEAVVWAKSHLK